MDSKQVVKDTMKSFLIACMTLALNNAKLRMMFG
jgi:hypothetical protein